MKQLQPGLGIFALFVSIILLAQGIREEPVSSQASRLPALQERGEPVFAGPDAAKASLYLLQQKREVKLAAALVRDLSFSSSLASSHFRLWHGKPAPKLFTTYLSFAPQKDLLLSFHQLRI